MDVAGRGDEAMMDDDDCFLFLFFFLFFIQTRRRVCSSSWSACDAMPIAVQDGRLRWMILTM